MDHQHEAECISCGMAFTCYDCYNRSVDGICGNCEEDLL